MKKYELLIKRFNFGSYQKQNIMNINYAFDKTYQTPVAELFNMETEGLLCTSNKPSASVEPWGNGGSLGDYEVK